MKTFIIGEAGSTHEGSLNRAKRLVDLAYDAGCNAVKFQFCSNYAHFAARRKIPIPKYRFSIEREWLPILSEYCADGDQIEWMCSTFLPEDIEVVAPYVTRFKVSAYESGDSSFIEKHLPFHKKMIISAPPDTDLFERPEVADLIYCVSLYPCPDEKLNLKQLCGFGDYSPADFKGLSDHSKNPLTGALAVAIGAQIIETHFRLEDTDPRCPDYAVARRPDELRQYVQNIREAEILLG